MKKLNLVAILLFVNTILIQAQSDFEGVIKWGEPLKVSKKESAPIPVGATESSFYSKKYVKKKQFLQKFDLKTLKLVKETELILKYKNFDLGIVSDFVFANKIVFITTYIDKEAEKQHYLIHEWEDDSQLGNPIEIAVTDWTKNKIILSKSALEKLKGSSAYSFEFIVSDDYETMMVSFKNTNGDTETVLFDENLEEVATSTMEMPFENFNCMDMRLSSSGKYYMIGFDYEMEESKGLLKLDVMKRGDNYILIHDALNGKMETVELDIKKDIYAFSIKILPDESLVAYGMYSNERAKGVTGAFFQKLNTKNQIVFTTLEEFEEDFITQFWTDREKKVAEKKKDKKNPKKQEEPSLYNYIIHDLAIKDNGDMVLLGEQYYMYITSHTYTDANGMSHTTTTSHYIYNDIIAVNCNIGGNVTWKEKVKKRQHSKNDGGYFSSFYTIVQGNFVFLMYNDKEGNMDDAEEAISSKKNRELKTDNVAALISFNDEGVTTRKTLFDYEGDESRTIVPKRCKKMSNDEIFLFATMSKRMNILGWMNL